MTDRYEEMDVSMVVCPWTQYIKVDKGKIKDLNNKNKSPAPHSCPRCLTYRRHIQSLVSLAHPRLGSMATRWPMGQGEIETKERALDHRSEKKNRWGHLVSWLQCAR